MFSFGSDELKKEFLAPTIAGDVVACLGVSEVQAGSDVSGTLINLMFKSTSLTSVYRQ